MFTRGAMIGIIFIPVQAAAFARIKPQDTGRASALFQSQRQIGSAVGVAFLGDDPRRAAQHAGWPRPRPPRSRPPPGVQAFHAAIVGAVILCLIGTVAALFLRDEDAAPTMRPRVVETAAESRPSPASDLTSHLAVRARPTDTVPVHLRRIGA